MAERQLAMKPAPVRVPAAVPSVLLQRKCACGGSSGLKGECEECKQHGIGLQRRASSGRAPAAAPPIIHNVLRSAGQPLDSATRSLMEPLLGHDFGRVRVHADARAAESARAVSARAYTVANELVFNSGEYEPRTPAGLGSLAHELAHVVQQTAGRAGTIPERIRIGDPGAPEEHEAEQVGRADWSRATLSVRDQPCLRRQPQKDDEPEKEPPPLIPLPHPFDRLDIKPVIPGPIDAPSTEDINKARWKLTHSGQGERGNPKCPPGWRMLQTGDCCEGSSVDPRHCCPPYRLTNLGRCCPGDRYADGSDCVKFKDTVPNNPVSPDPGQPSARPVLPRPRPTLPQGPPLTVSLDIYFKQDRPGGIVGDDKALRESLTVSGAATVDGVVSWLKRDPQFWVQLTGGASIEGPPAHNRELGEYRAFSVAAVLARQGIGRIGDPPGLPAACTRVEDGIHNCGDTLASKTIDERDRRVRATLFIPPGNP